MKQAPIIKTSAFQWVHQNLLSTKLNIVLTLIALVFLWNIVPTIANWLFFDATFTGNSSDACKVTDANGEFVDGPGACWTFVKIRWPQFLFGLWYTRNIDQIWRPILAFIIAVMLIISLTGPWFTIKMRYKIALVSLVTLPIVVYTLLNGAWLGLPEAKTNDWGGLTLTLVLASLGIVAALPIGILLALARQSSMPIIKWYSIMWIELFRGMPLITLLFIASVMLPYFFPLGSEIDKVVRAIVALTLFQSAYTAEAIRGGFSALPKGQKEASNALGLGYWQTTIFITLPQALKVSIPSIVNSFIQLFKDTSLVLIIGLLDLLNMVQIASRSTEWKGYESEGYLFAATVFFIFCYCMSQFSRNLERKLDTTNTALRVQKH